MQCIMWVAVKQKVMWDIVLICQGRSNSGGVVRHRSVQEVGTTLPAGRDLRFHVKQGSNVTVSADGLTASVMHASRDSGAAVITSSRPLRDDELFEFRIDRVIESWSASLEAGACSVVITCLLNYMKINPSKQLQMIITSNPLFSGKVLC